MTPSSPRPRRIRRRPSGTPVWSRPIDADPAKSLMPKGSGDPHRLDAGEVYRGTRGVSRIVVAPLLPIYSTRAPAGPEGGR